MSQNVLIEDCTFDQGDDAVSVKSGREDDAWALATPTRNGDARLHRPQWPPADGRGQRDFGRDRECLGRLLPRMPHPPGETNSAFNNLLLVKTNERRGGFIRNIHMTNITATTIAGGVGWIPMRCSSGARSCPLSAAVDADRGLHIAHVTVEQVHGAPRSRASATCRCAM
jgi:hypothetical protein